MHVNNDPKATLVLDGSRAACIDSIASVDVKKADSENPLVFVSIERRIGRCEENEDEDQLRARFSDDSQVAVREIRNIVFQKAAPEGAAPIVPRNVTPQFKGQEAFSHAFIPTNRLLFRYSALTYNSHAIHLDPDFCREEGHRGLVFHGPLALTTMCSLLRMHLIKESKGVNGFEAIKSVKYRVTRSLYAGEQVRVSGHRVGDGAWSVWAETPDGHVAAEGTVVTEKVDGVPGELYEDIKELGL